MRLTFVTGNKGKLHEARTALGRAGHDVVGTDLDPTEIQASDLEAVARAKCDALVGRLPAPYFVDDGGLFVEALHGFPGVYSAPALKTIGVPGILKLMDGVEDRRASFRAVVCYHDGLTTHAFVGRCDGVITHAPSDDGHGFGFDPIFVPEGHDQTFAQLPTETKNATSHRGRALAALADHLGEAA